MAAVHLFWAGVIVLCVAWLGVGRRIASVSRTPVRDVLVIAAAWALPLVLGPALFSLDVYSYLAQGALLHHGLNPYRVAPIALRRWHEQAILTAVSTNWRHTTAPYGPLFMAIAALVAGIAGHQRDAGSDAAAGSSSWPVSRWSRSSCRDSHGRSVPIPRAPCGSRSAAR